MCELVPVDDRLVAVRLKDEQKSSGGLYLPEKETRKSQIGKIVASGPGGFDENGNRRPNVAKEGQTVVFNTYSGNEVTINGKEYVILLNQDILAILD